MLASVPAVLGVSNIGATAWLLNRVDKAIVKRLPENKKAKYFKIREMMQDLVTGDLLELVADGLDLFVMDNDTTPGFVKAIRELIETLRKYGKDGVDFAVEFSKAAKVPMVTSEGDFEHGIPLRTRGNYYDSSSSSSSSDDDMEGDLDDEEFGTIMSFSPSVERSCPRKLNLASGPWDHLGRN